MRTILCFSAAAVLLLLCYATRFDIFARDYLLTAYILRNLAVELVCGLLIVLGLPRPAAGRLRIPMGLGWPAGMIALALWYAPPLLIASVNSTAVSILQALTWLIGGILFFLPLFSPAPDRRVKPMPHGVVYLLAALVFSSLLSLFIGFSRFGLYTPFLDAKDTLHILDQLQHRWGLTPEMDEQTACLLMWVLSLFVWLWSVMAMFWRMYKTPEAKDHASATRSIS